MAQPFDELECDWPEEPDFNSFPAVETVHNNDAESVLRFTNDTGIKENTAIEPVELPQNNNERLISIPEPIVQNVIASVNLCTVLDLRKIAISARNAEYNPTKVNAVVVRLRNPKCTGLIFRSGRMMVTGAKSEQTAKLGGRKIAKLCMKVGHPAIRFRGFKIENMVATADCGFPVRLEGLAHEHSSFCSYEPEIFPGLVYRYNPENANKAVVLVFVSGKVILTGCPTVAHTHSVFQEIYPVLAQYKK